MEFEDLLRMIGDFGLYQKLRVILFLIPASTLLPLFCMNTLFLLSSPEHWCFVPEMASSNLSLDIQHKLIRPKSVYQGLEGLSMCERHEVNYTQVLRDYQNALRNNETEEFFANTATWPTTTCSDGWVYDQSLYDSTAVTEWNLVCEDNHWPSLILTVFCIGSAVGNPIFGALSDKIGRRYTFYIAVIVTLSTLISPVFVEDFSLFVILRFLQGSVLPAIFQVPYIILVELVGPYARTRMIAIACITWTLGLSFLPLVAYLTRHWVLFTLITTGVALPYFLYWKFLPESPRWLLSQKRYEEAAKILTKIAETNKKDVPKDLLATLKKMGEIMEKQKTATNESTLDLIRNPSLRRNWCIVTFGWIANGMAYYGLQLNAHNLYGNEFVNFFLLSIVELPSYFVAWVLMESRLGRRWANVSLLALSGIACGIPVFVPPEYTIVSTISSLIGKFGSSAAFMVVYQQAAELIPTPLRAQGMGLGASLAAFVNICMPYIVYLAEYGYYIPFLVICVLCCVSACVVSCLPETLNENLPQTVKDSEDFGKGKKFFTLARVKKGEDLQMDDFTSKEVPEFLTNV